MDVSNLGEISFGQHERFRTLMGQGWQALEGTLGRIVIHVNKFHLVIFLYHKDILVCHCFLENNSGSQSGDEIVFVPLLVPEHQDPFFTAGNQEISIFGEVEGAYWLGMPMVHLAFRDHFVIFETDMRVESEKMVNRPNFALAVSEGEDIAVERVGCDFLMVFQPAHQTSGH